MKHTRKHMIPSRNLTKRHIYSRIRNTSAIFWNHSRVTVQTVAKWFKKRHSGIFCTFTTSLKFFSTTASAKRSVSMKSKSVKNMGSIGGRFAATACILASALILTACGGGGGSATDPVFVNPPPVIVTPALSIIASPVIPSIDGKTGVSTNVAAVISAEFTPVNFTNPTAAMFSAATSTGATFSCGGVKVNSGIFSPFSITQVTGTAKFTVTSSFSMTGLPALTNCIFSLPLTITGGGVASNPVTIGFSFTTGTTNLTYGNKTYALWTGAYPYAVSKTSVTPVANKTKYTFGVRPLGNCIIMDSSFTVKMNGKILTECQAADGSGRHMFYIDPTKDELYEYPDAIPSGITFHDVTPFNLVRNKTGWDSQTKVADGWYYTLLTGNWVLWFQNDNTGISTIVKEGTFATDGNINYLATYSN